MLKLDIELLDNHGVVSASVAAAMALGAFDRSEADIAVAVTGVAGPDPDERGNPVGLVYLACARRGQECFGMKRTYGDIGRSCIRYATTVDALSMIAHSSDG